MSDPQKLDDGQLESLASRVQNELRRRGRRVAWTDDSQRQALAFRARKDLGPNTNDLAFVCNESNQAVVATRLSDGRVLFYYCAVVACVSE